MAKRWLYVGDVNIEHGGYFFNKENLKYGHVDAVRVTACSDAGGPDNEWWVESLSVNIPNEDAKLEQVLSVCGWSLEDVDALSKSEAENMVIEACIAYGKYDVDNSLPVRIGPEQNRNGWDKHMEEYLVKLRGNTSLCRYVKRFIKDNC